MLTFAQLKEHYSKRNEFISPRLALVEYLQYELLDSLYKQKGSEHLSFIGGTSLRICYHGNRFSEDLDFDNFALSFKEFQIMLQGVIDDMKRKGFAVEFRFIEKGAYHCYIKFPHLLHEHKISDHASEKILIKMESMRQESLYAPRAYLMNQFDLYRNLLVAPEDILLSQKLITVRERKRTKGRDFYDVSFLYGMTEPNRAYMEEKMKMSWNDFLEQMVVQCSALDFDVFAKEVEPFLIRKDQIERVKTFLEFIKSKRAS